MRMSGGAVRNNCHRSFTLSIAKDDAERAGEHYLGY
jgi:hypothetical protein